MFHRNFNSLNSTEEFIIFRLQCTHGVPTLISLHERSTAQKRRGAGQKHIARFLQRRFIMLKQLNCKAWLLDSALHQPNQTFM